MDVDLHLRRFIGAEVVDQAATEDKISGMSSTMTKLSEQAQSRAGQRWDKLEAIFDGSRGQGAGQARRAVERGHGHARRACRRARRQRGETGQVDSGNCRCQDDEDRANQDLPPLDEYAGTIEPSGRPVDELDLHDRRPGLDEMQNPNSRVGMGQMEPRPITPITGTDTNAELIDPNASDTAIAQ